MRGQRAKVLRHGTDLYTPLPRLHDPLTFPATDGTLMVRPPHPRSRSAPSDVGEIQQLDGGLELGPLPLVLQVEPHPRLLRANCLEFCVGSFLRQLARVERRE